MTASLPFPPPDYVRIRAREQDVVALEPLSSAVIDALADHASLAGWAEAHAVATVAGGRGPLWRVDLGGRAAAVRHYRRGGWMGPLLGDRYFGRPPRPFAELAASETLRRRGVRTPRVLAAVVAPAGAGYRGDIVTEWLSPGLDLAELLRPNLYPAGERAAAIAAAGRTIGCAHAAGLDHPDLRPRNVFLEPLGVGSWRAALLDLDRAGVARPGEAPAKKKTSPASGALSPRSVERAA